MLVLDVIERKIDLSSVSIDPFNVELERCTLLDSMIKFEEIRTNSLKNEGKAQIKCVSPSSGWIATIFLIRGRALDNILHPFLVVVAHATIYTTVQELYLRPSGKLVNENLQSFHTFVLNSVLSFLLVFRLNRAAGRYWSARQYWGDIVAKCRSSIGTIMVHGNHNVSDRDDSVRWIASFCIATMALLRGDKNLPFENFVGLLNRNDVTTLEQQNHPPMYAIDQAKHHLKKVFDVEDERISSRVAFSRTTVMNEIEYEINAMIKSGG
jgi:predicted membrane chloride channel (bestrophin family)